MGAVQIEASDAHQCFSDILHSFSLQFLPFYTLPLPIFLLSIPTVAICLVYALAY